MAALTTDVGTGATVVFGTSSFTSSINSISWSMSRPSIDTTHMGTTTTTTHMPGDLYSAGELTLDLNFDPDQQPPIGSAAETITVTFDTPGGTKASWAASGFMTAFDFTASKEEKMTATATIQFSGDITYVADGA